MKVLANDGLAKSGIAALGLSGFEVDLTTVAQDQLVDYINTNEIEFALTSPSKLVLFACYDSIKCN